MPGRCGTRIWRPGAEPSSAPGRLSEATSDPQSLPLRERRPMPELVILNVPQDVLSRMRRLANKGDEEARRWLKVELWKDYTPPFACFLCDGEVHEVNATLSLPDKKPRKTREPADDDRAPLLCL